MYAALSEISDVDASTTRLTPAEPATSDEVSSVTTCACTREIVVGAALGARLGRPLGARLGRPLGAKLGRPLGSGLGRPLGAKLG